jgi:hypothetical protein
MAAHGEWAQKGATLSDTTAQKDYGVTRDFIVKGIQAGKLEYQQGSTWGNPFLRILRRQLEQYIAEELGAEHVASNAAKTELRKLGRDIATLKRKLAELEARKVEIEKLSGTSAVRRPGRAVRG